MASTIEACSNFKLSAKALLAVNGPMCLPQMEVWKKFDAQLRGSVHGSPTAAAAPDMT
jgi:hypothetical protein